MIDLAFVERLIRALDESSLDSLELERGGTRVRLSKSPAVASVAHLPTPTAGAAVSNPFPGLPASGPASVTGSVAEPTQVGGEQGAAGGLLEVVSPMVGTFYEAPAPDADPYVAVGQPVKKGTVLCIIEAMKLMNELESEVEGTVVKIMVENAQPVEYGQVLFLIDPS